MIDSPSMAVHRCCNKEKVKKGLWSPEEDEKLVRYITSHGHISWTSLPKRAGLERCGKSCRLRWINYLKPEVKRGSFTSEEEQIIIDCHRILGNRWARIAKHLPGRTDNEVKNFWNSCIKKKLIAQGLDPRTHNLLKTPKNNSIPRTQKHRTLSVEVDPGKNPRRAKATLPSTAPAPPLAPIITTLPPVHSQVVEIPEGEKLNLVLPNRDLESDPITNLDCVSSSTVQQSSCSSLPNQSHRRLFDTKVSGTQTIQSSDVGSESQRHNQKWILGQGGVTMSSTGGMSMGIENSSCFEVENKTESMLNESALIDFLLFESTFLCRPMCDDLTFTDSMTWNYD